ncbi:MAG: hypothetical protein COA99_12720 [Moraxellaceae bacterium]|nr:MAG: hypothetical protein COA99_12720 [Moraxellaceae bacterium]
MGHINSMDNLNRLKSMEIHEDQLKALLDASVSTALSHRGKAYEEYVLGQQEATANVVYVLCVGQDNRASLEQSCQRYAQQAIERLTEIHPPDVYYGFGGGYDQPSYDDVG